MIFAENGNSGSWIHPVLFLKSTIDLAFGFVQLITEQRLLYGYSDDSRDKSRSLTQLSRNRLELAGAGRH